MRQNDRLSGVGNVHDRRPVGLGFAGQGVDFLSAVMADVGIIPFQHDLQAFPPLKIGEADPPHILRLRGKAL